MLLDRLQFGVDNATAVEGAERQRDVQRFDEKPHADGRAARRDGEADPCLVQSLHRALRSVGQRLVLGQQRTIDVGNDERDAGHSGCLLS